MTRRRLRIFEGAIYLTALVVLCNISWWRQAEAALICLFILYFWLFIDYAFKERREKQNYAIRKLEKVRKRWEGSVKRAKEMSALRCWPDGKFHFRVVCRGEEVVCGYFVNPSGLPVPHYFPCQEKALRALRLALAMSPFMRALMAEEKERLEGEIALSGLPVKLPTMVE